MIYTKCVVCGAYEENCYLLWDEDKSGLVIIDPGDDLPAIERAIAAAGRAPGAILLTHGHFDHILAAAPLREKYGAKVYIHPLDEHMLASPSAAMMNTAICRLPFAPLKPDIAFPRAERFALDVCGLHLTGIHTPGHTPGGVSLICEEGKALFSGDTLFSYGYGRYDFPGGDRQALMKSILALLALDGDLTVYSGHGGSYTMAAIQKRWGIT